MYTKLSVKNSFDVFSRMKQYVTVERNTLSINLQQLTYIYMCIYIYIIYIFIARYPSDRACR